jgi:glycosyltransferase involved in cell wall biosynthesis
MSSELRTEMPKISIALATFNGQKFLPQQLESLAAQRVPILELVACDDGSGDNTITLLRDFATRVPFPVHIIQNSIRLGYRINFIKAARTCRGDLIAFCDQDDVWHPQKLEILSRHFADPSVELVFHNAILTDEVGTPVATLFGHKGFVFAPLETRPWLIVPGLAQMFRRNLLRFASLHDISVDPYTHNQKMPHDLWCLFWASVLGKTIYVPQKLVEYRQHRANTSGWPHPRWADFLRDNIHNAEAYAIANAVSCDNRATILERALTIAPRPESAKIKTAISYYRALHTYSEARVEVFRGRHFTERTRKIWTLWKRGGYSSLGFDNLMLDLTIGLAFTSYGRAQRPSLH